MSLRWCQEAWFHVKDCTLYQLQRFGQTFTSLSFVIGHLPNGNKIRIKTLNWDSAHESIWLGSPPKQQNYTVWLERWSWKHLRPCRIQFLRCQLLLAFSVNKSLEPQWLTKQCFISHARYVSAAAVTVAQICLSSHAGTVAEGEPQSETFGFHGNEQDSRQKSRMALKAAA